MAFCVRTCGCGSAWGVEDRYHPDSYATLRDRLDALHSSVQVRDAEVIDLSTTVVRPQRGRDMQ